jgi:hypothetical protein
MTPVHLNDQHRDTVEKIFSHSSSSNIEWRQVVSLLSAVGTTTEEHNGKLRVTLGPESEVLRPPHGKDIDEHTLVDLRRMLTQAGFGPAGDPPTADQRSRDHGDGQWGAPT